VPINLLEDEMPEKSVKRTPVNLLADEMPSSEEKESLGTSIGMAPFRIGKDLGDIIFERLKSIPSYIEKGKSEIPGLAKIVGTQLLNSQIPYPLRNAEMEKTANSAVKQELAGLAELGQNIFNTPHDISNYASNRLHLVPRDINEKIQMARMPDSQEIINETFGTPKVPGEALIRGITRNLETGIGAGGIASAFNPMKLTSGNIAKNIINARKELKEKYSGQGGLYDQLEQKAIQRGVDLSHINFSKIKPKEIDLPSVDNLMTNKTISNAQKAISDLGFVERRLEKKQLGEGLDSEGKKRLKNVKDAKTYIQENMFKDKSGKVHKDLLNEHQQIQQGYANEVIPYTKNKKINEYLRGELLADELVPGLMKGKFVAKAGKQHKPLMIRRSMGKHPAIAGALGLGSAGGLGALLYKALSGA
jgi:hypothetical protein